MLAGEKLIDGLKSSINGRTLSHFLGDETGFFRISMLFFNYFLLIFTNVLKRKIMTLCVVESLHNTVTSHHIVIHRNRFMVRW